MARSLPGRRVILCGVPASRSGNLQNLSPDDRRLYTGMVRQFNATQRELGREAGMGFLDLHGLTDAGEGQANGYWHIDAVHLRLDAYLEAFKHRFVAAGR